MEDQPRFISEIESEILEYIEKLEPLYFELDEAISEVSTANGGNLPGTLFDDGKKVWQKISAFYLWATIIKSFPQRSANS